MITRIIQGAAVSTALHAFVLFGLNWPHRPPPSPPIKTAELIEWIPSMPPEDPPIDEVNVQETSAPKGRPDVSRPMLDDIVTGARGPFVIEPMVSRITPPDLWDNKRISAEPPGIPDGIGGPGSGLPVISRDMLDNEPRSRARVAPNYPAEARSAGITGEVVVEFVVDETGQVRHPRVLRSSDSVFEAATLRAVERWRFEPGKKNGKPVRFRMAVPVVFNLDV